MKKKSILLFSTLFLLLSSFFQHTTVTVLAAEDEEKVQLLEGVSEAEVIAMHQKMDSVLHLDNGWLYQDVIRSAGWGVLKGIIWIVNYIEDGVNGILKWNDFYESEGIGELINRLIPFVMGLFLLALIYLGYQFITNKIEKREEILMNVLMAFSLIFLVPALMPYMDKVLSIGIDELDGKEDLKLSEALVKQNVADVKYYVDSGFAFNQLGLPINKNVEKGEKEGTTDYSKANKIVGTQLNITEKLDLQSDKGMFGWWSTGLKKQLADNNKLGHDVLMTQTVYQGDGNKVRLKALAPNQVPTTALGQEAYYRYHVNWGTLLFSFIVIGAALAITVVKMARVIFDLGFHAIFTMFVSATDLTGGQRTKKMVTEIVSSFAVLFVMVLILKIFTLYVNWVTGLGPSVGGIIMVLMLIAGAWALIDAPDIVQRLLGIDAGLRSGWQAMMGAYAGAKMTGAGLKGIGKAVAGADKVAKGGLAFGKGLAGAPPTSGGVKPMPNTGGFNHDSNVSAQGAQDVNRQMKGNSEGAETGGSMDQAYQSSISAVGGQTEEAPMPNSSTYDDTGSIDLNTQATQAQEQDSPSTVVGNVASMPSSMTDASKSMPNKATKISPQQNPYSNYGIAGGTRHGQQTADLQARAYNTGLQARQNIAAAGKTIGAVAMTGTRFIASPMRSTQNIAAAAGQRISATTRTVGQSIKAMPTQAMTGVGQMVSRVNTPIGAVTNQGAVGVSHTQPSVIPNEQASSQNVTTAQPMNTSIKTMPNVMSQQATQAAVQSTQSVPNVSKSVGNKAMQQVQQVVQTDRSAVATQIAQPTSMNYQPTPSINQAKAQSINAKPSLDSSTMLNNKDLSNKNIRNNE